MLDTHRKIHSLYWPIHMLMKSCENDIFPQLVESETVAHTTESQCRERGIVFYRVSPKLDDIIAASETSNEKLCHMVVCTWARCRQQIAEIVRTLTCGPDDVK